MVMVNPNKAAILKGEFNSTNIGSISLSYLMTPTLEVLPKILLLASNLLNSLFKPDHP